jgi:chromosome segregation ATPase
MKKILAVLMVAATVTACDRSKAELEQRVLELQTVSAQKDSLIQEVMSTTQFVGDLTADLAAVKALNAGRPVAAQAADLEGKSPAEVRATVRERVRELASRLDQSEARLSQSRARVQSLSSSNAEMQRQLAAYDSTITSLRVVIEGQKIEISALSEQVLGLQQANVELAQRGDELTQEKVQLEEAVATMTVESNKVYYVIGTSKELTEKGIIAKRGGFLGMGGTYTPGRALEEDDFIEIDRMRDSIITFPDSDKVYQVVSVQDTRYLEVQPDKDNKIRAGLKIASPEMFWGPSRFLILDER